MSDFCRICGCTLHGLDPVDEDRNHLTREGCVEAQRQAHEAVLKERDEGLMKAEAAAIQLRQQLDGARLERNQAREARDEAQNEATRWASKLQESAGQWLQLVGTLRTRLRRLELLMGVAQEIAAKEDDLP